MERVIPFASWRVVKRTLRKQILFLLIVWIRSEIKTSHICWWLLDIFLPLFGFLTIMNTCIWQRFIFFTYALLSYLSFLRADYNLDLLELKRVLFLVVASIISINDAGSVTLGFSKHYQESSVCIVDFSIASCLILVQSKGNVTVRPDFWVHSQIEIRKWKQRASHFCIKTPCP